MGETKDFVRGRLARQLLGGNRGDSVGTVVQRLVGIQSQAVGPARLAFRARADELTAADVDGATRAPEVVRTWLMRGTLHLIDVADLDWLLTVHGQPNIRSGARRREQLGLTDAVLAAALAALPDVLEDPLPRAEVVTRLREAGVEVDATGQAPAHLLAYAASTGLVCRGPETDEDEPTYVLTERWLRRPVDLHGDRRAALSTLARRYLAGYAPATGEDFAHWSGLSKTEARTALDSLENAGATVTAADGRHLLLHPDHDPVPHDAPAEAEDEARLLGAFDTLLLGYRSRDALVAPEYASRLRAGGGMIAPTALDGTQAVGTWSVDRTRQEATVVLKPFTSVRRARLAAWEQEVADLSRFLDRPFKLTVAS